MPLVGEDRGNRTLWLGLGGIGLAGVLLFFARGLKHVVGDFIAIARMTYPET